NIAQGDEEQQSPDSTGVIEGQLKPLPQTDSRRLPAPRRRKYSKSAMKPGLAVKQPVRRENSDGADLANKAILSSIQQPPADVVRIEIQTSDPNIRIIWLSPKAADASVSDPMTETE
ncbi:MAG TPA: hypothetical protein VNO70_27525, partial [Blastocatellia bacterium]|nr:hypothetical protein [Blastocatellia bacterium]